MHSQFFTALVASATGVAAVAVTAAPADACDWDYCGAPAYLLPEVEAPAATIPANAALLWTPLRLTTDASTAVESLELRDAGGAAVAVEVAVVDLPRFHSFADPYVVRPVQELQPGAQYTLHTPNTECIGGDQVPIARAFLAAEAAALPDSLGTLSAGPVVREDLVVAQDAACSWTQDVVRAHLSLELDASAEPWADVLVYETIVNGAFWGPSDFSGAGFATGSSWIGRGQDLVFAICNDNPYSEHSYLLPGTHTVRMRARLPGSDVVLESNELALDLTCNDEPEEPEEPGTPAGGCSAAPSAPATSTAGLALVGALLWAARRCRRPTVAHRERRGGASPR